ncbi:MAG: hypothetical protein CYG60_05295 [Actinobacteria bacterium]|nr:MAG: hypothetical protein CYG60_05295 [Actinomycetota bacterium]
MGPDEQGDAAGRWLDVRQAADALGLSSDAVRKRIARGTLRSRKGEDGSVSVWLDAAGQRQDGDQPTSGTEAGRALDADLVEELRDRVRYLERQLDVRTEELREHRRLLAGLIERVPELEAARQAPPDAPGSAPGGAKGPGEGQGPPEAPTGSEAASSPPRSWWQRIFGG